MNYDKQFNKKTVEIEDKNQNLKSVTIFVFG